MNDSPRDIIRQELIGRPVHVVESTDPGHVCTEGFIRAETREIVSIESDKKMIMVPKKDCVFEITLPDGTQVRIDGNLLRGRPEDRMKKRLRSW